MKPRLIERLHAIVGDAGLVTDSAKQAAYLTDWSGKWHGAAAAIIQPANTAEVAEIVRVCHETRTPIVPQGGNTGMSGGATPDGSGEQVLLSLSRMTRIRHVDPIDNTLTADAGVILETIQAAAQEADRLFPLSLGAEGRCTIGGNLATNAGGTAMLRYGNTRDLVLGIEVVLPDGRIWNGLRELRKDNTGYDLRDLFIGSEGTLGIITGVVLKLFPMQRGRATAWLGVQTPDAAVSLLTQLRARYRERLNTFEMMSASCVDLVIAQCGDTVRPIPSHPYHLLIELSDTDPNAAAALLGNALDDALRTGLARDAALARDDRQRHHFWRIRDSISQAQMRVGKGIEHDIALPISRIPAFIAAADAMLAEQFPHGTLANFGSLGDGHLHYDVLLDKGMDDDVYQQNIAAVNRVVHDLVASHDGSISAEHGIGQLRRDALKAYKSPIEMELMMRIKQAFDPNHLLNPGKML
jgi:FAD/FMN-containing dehydrogenase